MTDVQDIPIETIDGRPTTLGEHAGDVLLVVNVASQCGLTPQYEALEALYEQHRDRGFKVLGFPANNFGAQEPGTNEEIVQFCTTTYSVEFPLHAKISVKGDDQHPLYAALTDAVPRAEGDPDGMRKTLDEFGMDPSEDPDVLWNFEKFLVSRDGRVTRRFAPTITPDDPLLVAAVEEALAADA